MTQPSVEPASGTVSAPGLPSNADRWWRDAVIYQVYIRSFCDGNGDGVGDIAGIRSRLDYLAGLSVDAIWINPWYPSPMMDAGYDVADFRAIDPEFGTLAEAEALIAEAHARGTRVLLDIVPNHLSDQHAWFKAALSAAPGSPERDRFMFRPGRGAGGELPPNDWLSHFGGPAWTRVTEPDGSDGEWFLHLFTPQQPDLNWGNPEVHEEFESVMRFWFDRGVDGFRIDVAHGLVKAPGLPDAPQASFPSDGPGAAPHPAWDQDGVHEIYRAWRRVADGYEPRRVFTAEAWVDGYDRLTKYIRPDELNTAFNFDFLTTAWLPGALRRSIENGIAAHEEVGAPPTWVLSNHDVAREVSRFARPQDVRELRHLDDFQGLADDPQLGVRRARAAALLLLSLPGNAYVYQGEELGLPEVEDIPAEALRDPIWEQSGHERRGRDGCRVPLPWSGEAPPFGFSPSGASAAPWLPQPADWRQLTAQAQSGDPQSMLSLYREALSLRRTLPALGDGSLSWLSAPDGVLAFRREPGFACVVNLSDTAVALPIEGELLLASAPLSDGRVPPDTAVWLAPRD
jgi:alpha-glucosidase